jgi:ABC-type thiamin/hydroxymethylpyrimidine transport system permease subunit
MKTRLASLDIFMQICIVGNIAFCNWFPLEYLVVRLLSAYDGDV